MWWGKGDGNTVPFIYYLVAASYNNCYYTLYILIRGKGVTAEIATSRNIFYANIFVLMS